MKTHLPKRINKEHHLMMRTTLNIDDDLMREALRQTSLRSKTEVVERALRVLLERESRRRLKALYGKVPEVREVRRRRS